MTFSSLHQTKFDKEKYEFPESNKLMAKYILPIIKEIRSFKSKQGLPLNSKIPSIKIVFKEEDLQDIIKIELNKDFIQQIKAITGAETIEYEMKN